MLDTRQAHRPRPFPSQHAVAFGQDKYGYWQTLVISGVDVCFRWVAPGNFMMGSPKDENGRYENEDQHDVTLTTGFWLAEMACTQTLWQAITGKKPSDFEGEENPVDNVSWEDVDTEFLPVLTKTLIDLQARLPTEAEWEFACRAGTDTAFSFGDTLHQTQARHAEIWDISELEELQKARSQLKENDRYGTCPVTDFEPNPWGFRQMHGNVYEWCSDWLSDYPNHSVTDPQVLVEPADRGERVLRGGSWNYLGRYLRSALRYGSVPDSRNLNFGFRLALGPLSSGERSD